MKNIKLKKKIRTDRVDAACILLTNRFEHLLEVLREFWTNCQKYLDNMASHKRTLNRLKALLKDKSADEKVVEKIQIRLNKHKGFGVDIKREFIDCKDMVDDVEQLKDKEIWIAECHNVLNTSLNVSWADVLDMKDTGE